MLMRSHVIAAGAVALASVIGVAVAGPAQAATRPVFASIIGGGAEIFAAPNGQVYGYTSGQVEAWCYKLVDERVWISISQFEDVWVHREALDLRPNAVPRC
jgi:hypothetical protein